MDRTERFSLGKSFSFPGIISLPASFRWNGGHDTIYRSLNDTILEDFKLEPQPNLPLISFDTRRGLYGPEQGGGAKLLQSNLVSNLVWVLLIVGLAAVAVVFDRINTIDPEFLLFRAFAEVNSMDCVSGPLALEDKEFRFAKYQGDNVGHIGFRPAAPT